MKGFGFRRKKATDGVPKKNKYGNEKVVIDGMTFDSKGEGNRYLFLKDAEKKGIISNLRCHVTYELLPNIYKNEVKHLKTKDKVVQRLEQRKVEFTPDFVYTKNDADVAEDFKGSKFVISKDFPLRAKMLLYFHHLKCRVVTKPTEPI